MKRTTAILPLLLVLLVVAGIGAVQAESRIVAFCGSASKPAMEEAARSYEAKTGTKVELLFGGSGTMLAQMKLARKGDVYIPGSPDFMEIAEKQGLVDPATRRILAYLVPAINVQPGNPKNIRVLADLARPGIRVGIGNPESVCVGLYAVEILDRAGLLKEVQPNIITHAPSCDATEALVSLKKVDAVIGWDVFPKWNPGRMEAVFLKPDQLPRLAYIPAAVSSFTKERGLAVGFIDFLASKDGQAIFAKWGYLSSETEARKLAPNAGIGGTYTLPDHYAPARR